MPDAEHVIEYHVLTAGECWAGIVGEPPVKMQRGDIVLLPQGDAHVVSSAPGMRADPASTATSISAARNGRFAFITTTRRRQVDLEGKLPPPGAAGLRREFRLRFHRLRSAAVQPADRDAAAFAALAGRRRQLVERAIRDVRRGRVGRETPRQRSRARALERDDVRRRDSPPRRSASRANDGLARGLARPLRGPRAGADARAPFRAVDDRRLEQPSRLVALRAARALRVARRSTARAVPDELAHAACSRKLLEGRSSVATVAVDVGYDSEAASLARSNASSACRRRRGGARTSSSATEAH